MSLLVNFDNSLKLIRNVLKLSVLTIFCSVSSQPTFADGETKVLSFDYFSQADGLPNNAVQCIFQDRKGWIWLGTSQGLSRFDGYHFVNFTNNPKDSSSLSGNIVRVIYEDSKGNLLIGTENGGLNVFDHGKERFEHPYKDLPEFKSREVSVNTIAGDSAGNLYLGTDRSLLKIDIHGNLIRINPTYEKGAEAFSGSFIRIVKPDRAGKLWVGTDNGLFLYDPVLNKIEIIPIPLSLKQSREVFKIFMDSDDSLWVGTYSNGLFIINPSTKLFRHLNLEPYHERTETIRTVSEGIMGDYWIGTRGGLYVYSKTMGVTGYFRHDNRENRSLANNSVLDIFNDNQGNTWIGTRGGLNFLAKSKQVFRNFSALPNDNHYLNSNIIYAFWIDKEKRIWVGTEDGGINIYNPETGLFRYLMAQKNSNNTLSQNCIKALLDDGKGNLWIGTFWGGIDILNLETGKYTHFLHKDSDPGSVSDNRVWALCMDADNNIWVGTTIGLDRFNPMKQSFDHFPDITHDQQVNWISIDSEKNLWIGTLDEVIIFNPASKRTIRYSDHSRSFLEDSENRYWIATIDKGIALYSKSQGPLKYFSEHDGLANNQALCMLEDNNHFLWISTSNGLSRFDPKNKRFQNFSSRDGLRNDQFSYGAAYKENNGKLLFGGISGFNEFDPENIPSKELNVPLVFTELRIFNKPVQIEDGKDAILTRSISETSWLDLKYEQNVFTVEFAALDFINSTNNLYSYYLEGFDKTWNEPSNSRTATYTNLNPGDYKLRIKRILPGRPSDSQELVLNITILPPFWMTWWFRSIMILMITALIFYLVRSIINREKIKHELILEKIKARDLHELDMLKLRLFTDISHEIRTPLTLILGPLEKLIHKEVPEGEIPSHMELVYRNTKQLDRLINQLLDFRKMETGNLKLHMSRNDMVSLVSSVVNSFNDYANEKQIILKFHSLKKSVVAMFDPDKVETILNNLISNAIKYTNEGGMVSVNLSLVFGSEEEETLINHAEEQYIEISVKDTGKGIQENQLGRVFNRFFRADEKNESIGTGIGLALVNDLVKMHKGTVSVISKPGKGSKFRVRLPYLTEAKPETRTEQVAEVYADESPSGDFNDAESDNLKESNARVMLIVEDNADVRYFIRSHFNTVYRIYEARNGKEGWDLAVKTIPDVIVSDVLMPDVDGYEFCRHIKRDERTSHIPVIILTALKSKEHEIEGLACGADDYITKPFDISILQTKIENMLQARRLLKEKYTRQIILKPSDITITSPDERFLRKAMEVVEKNIDNSDLDIELFATEVGVSRMQLYRKFDALTNMTVKEFIRSVRLKRAAQLLLDKKLNVTEVAYAVGFKDLSHFRKCFHQEYGMSASEYVKQNYTSTVNDK